MNANAANLEALLDGSTHVGRLTTLSFTSARITTGRSGEEKSGGVLLGSWLLASRSEDDTEGPVLLLRVDAASRPGTSDHLGDLGHPYRGYRATVVGQFDTDESGGLGFASQTDRVGVPHDYQVRVPSPNAVSLIASYSRDPNPDLMPAGVVRFSSARTAARHSGRDATEVNININDFIGRRSAIFGITRSGKSSAIKSLATAIVKQTALNGEPIGQIVFDPQGEYAEFNHQDGTALRLVGDDDQVRIYRALVDPVNPDPKERLLLLDFYDPGLIEVVWDIVSRAVSTVSSPAVKAFASVEMSEPDLATRRFQWESWARGRLAFYGLLHKCGFSGGFPNGQPVWFSMSRDASSAYIQEQKYAGNMHLLPTQHPQSPEYWGATTPEQCSALTDWFMAKAATLQREREAPPTQETGRRIARWLNVLGESAGAWNDMGSEFWQIASIAQTAKTDVLSALRPLVAVHDSNGRVDVAEAVWEDMLHGRLVIVDLSIGSESVVKMMARRIVERLLAEENARFRAGEAPVPVQIIAEEAHNLFERGQMAAEDPWVRIAKEGAKYRIGLMYATQEVTSIDQRILANTHNWVILHLNSEVEAQELAQYSGFAAFAEDIRTADDVGYVRLKTMSSPFIVPVQFNKFSHEAINDARRAQRLEPLTARDVGPSAVPVPETMQRLMEAERQAAHPAPAAPAPAAAPAVAPAAPAPTAAPAAPAAPVAAAVAWGAPGLSPT